MERCLDIRLSDSTFVVANCESTGLDADSDAIFDLALVRFAAGKPVERLCSYLWPDRAIPASVLRSCQMSVLDLIGEPRFEKLLPELVDFVGYDPIVAHDAEITEPFMREIGKGQPWLSAVELAPRVARFMNSRDFSPRGLLDHADLDDHQALRELPQNRAEGEAMATGIVRCELLRELEHRFDALDELGRLTRVRQPKAWFNFGAAYRGYIADMPEHALRWILLDASKPPRQRCLHVDKDTLFAIRVHLEAYASASDNAPRRAS